MIEDLESSNISKLFGKLMGEQNDTSKVVEQEPDLYDDMSKLKDRILGLLQGYKSSIKEKDNAKLVRKKIREDAKVIKNDYSQIIEKINQSVDYSMISNNDNSYMVNPKQEQEMNNMFNLVEEFLEKFDGKKAQTNLYTSIIQEKLMIDSQVINDSQLQPDNNFQLNNSDTSFLVASQASNNVDDTFYSAGDAVQKLDKKIADMKQQLQNQLKSENFSYSQTIIMEAIDNLSQVLQTQESSNIKKIIDKIETSIKKLGEDQNTMKLYQLLQSALETSQLKQTEIKQSAPQVQNQPVKDDPGQRRRKFFDVALKFKQSLPANHPGKKMLVSMIYDEILDEGIPENNWTKWLETRVSKM